MTPRSIPPTTAPGIEPKPPRTAAMNPLIATSPIFDERKITGAMRTPAIAPTAAARTQDAEYTRATLTPMGRAARWFWATARIAPPGRAEDNTEHRRARR